MIRARYPDPDMHYDPRDGHLLLEWIGLTGVRLEIEDLQEYTVGFSTEIYLARIRGVDRDGVDRLSNQVDADRIPVLTTILGIIGALVSSAVDTSWCSGIRLDGSN